MGKSACGEKNGLRKGPWTAEEDQKLINYIQKHGKGKWRTLPKNAELKRCGKSCRLRWTNYLRPDIKRGKFSLEEEESIIQLHCVWGNRWSAIAARLPGRTDNEIKNYWNTRIKKRLSRMGIDPDTHNPLFHLHQLSSMLTSSQLNPSSFHALDPNLLGLPEFLFCQRKNPEIIPQNLQGNQFGYTQLIQNQFPSFPPYQLQIPIQEIQSSTSTNTIPLLDEAQFMQATLQNFSPNLTNFSSQNSMPILWQNNGEAPNFSESFVPMQNSDYQYSNQSIISPLSDNQMFISDKTGDIPDFSFMSTHLSPSSSTHTPLNTLSATCIDGGAEEERDSYCSNMMMFGIPERLDFEGLGCVNTPEEFYH